MSGMVYVYENMWGVTCVCVGERERKEEREREKVQQREWHICVNNGPACRPTRFGVEDVHKNGEMGINDMNRKYTRTEIPVVRPL